MKIIKHLVKPFIICCFLLLLVGVGCSQNAQATPSAEQLEIYSQNNILFYDPTGGCVDSGTSSANGIYKGTTYALTDGELLGVTRMAYKENGSSVATIKNEASQMANLYEHKKPGKEFAEWLSQSGWYSTHKYFNDTSINPPDEYIEAVRDVITNGNRTLPVQVIEHHSYGSITGFNDGVKLTDKSEFIQGKTVVYQKAGLSQPDDSITHWVFWSWADPGTMKGDPFGYYEGNSPTAATTTNVGNVSCSSNGTASSNAIAAKAIELAWPQAENANALNRATDALKAAAEQNSNIRSAKDCGKFVAAVVLSSGVDPAFPSGGTANILPHLQNSSLWSEVQPVTTDDLLPGDVFIYRNSNQGHTLIYLGDNQYAEAALDEYYGAVRSFSEKDSLPNNRNPFNQYTSGKKPYHIFRLTSSANSYVQTDNGSIGCNCSSGSSLKSGGYESIDEAARAIIDPYNQADLSSYGFLMPDTGDYHDNCVALSNWFIINHTNITTSIIHGDGRDIAQNLVDYAATQGITLSISSTPSVYSIASWTAPSENSLDGNHTGIVVGINTENDTILIAEAGWNQEHSAGVHSYSLSALSNNAAYQYVNINNNLTKSLVK